MIKLCLAHRAMVTRTQVLRRDWPKVLPFEEVGAGCCRQADLSVPMSKVSSLNAGCRHLSCLGYSVFQQRNLRARQKKRRKRSLEGKLSVGDMILNWQLLSEPLWSTDHGYKGLRISVALDGRRAARGLILQYPYPTNEHGSPLPLPQRPNSQTR